MRVRRRDMMLPSRSVPWVHRAPHGTEGGMELAAEGEAVAETGAVAAALVAGAATAVVR